VSNNYVAQVSSDGSSKILQGYNGTSGSITNAKAANNTLYLGLGEQGLATYNYDPSQETLTLVRTSVFYFKQRLDTVYFTVDEFAIDLTGGSLYILDYV
jgi:hypothetical protein